MKLFPESKRISRRAAFFAALLFTLIPSVFADDFSALRLKWRDMLTEGTNANRANPLYSNWIAEVESTAQSYWNSLNTGLGRTSLFSSYGNLAADSSDITTTYERLRAMALGYAVPGSVLETNAALAANIISGLDWMHVHYYNATSVVYDNWYDFEIAAPRALNDTVVLLYSNLSPAQISNYMSAVDHFSPTPSYTSISSPVTAYNKVWKSLVVSVRGAIVQDSAKIDLARSALSDVFPNVKSGDGFYADGSFIFHDEIAYNTGYGVGLLDTMGAMMQLLQGSAWPITDPAQTNVFRWVYDAYEPFIVKGSAMDMTSGRYPTRVGNHERGHELIGAILRVTQVAPPPDAAAIKSFAKAAIQSDTSLNFLNTQFPPYNVWADSVLNDTNVAPRVEVTEHRQFPGMDRVVHRKPNWTFGLSMSSKRVANYESTRGENLRGWFTGEGMTYLYNNDLTHYAGNFWATVDPYRLAGTSVDTIVRTNGSGDGYNSPNTHAGGASLLGRYGVAVMHLNAYGSDTMSARNSWFMFDDEIVCVGNSLNSDYGRETIVENRRLSLYGNNPFVVNGVAKPTGCGWSETMAGTSWAHLSGSSPGSDIGYYFPTATTVKALRESRSGRFYDVNTTYGSKSPSTGNYLTMYLDHGSNAAVSASYSYVLLPGMCATQVAAYAASPDITVVQNNSKTTTVKENRLGITAVNFWSDSSNFISGVSSDRKAAVILRNDGNVLDIGMSEPTQTNTAGLRIEIHTPALSALSLDPDISVLRLTPTIKLVLNTTNRFGATLSAKFLLNAAGQRPTVTLSTPGDKNMDAPATVTLAANARDPDGTIARLDFYSSTARIAQVFAPQSNLTNVTVPNLLPGIYNFSVIAVDNSGLMATSGPVSVCVYTPKSTGSGTGLVGEYYRDASFFRTLALTRTDPNINFSWPDYLSHPIPFAPHFRARWMGKIQAQRSGLHQFHTETDEGGRLWVDGRMLIDNWETHPVAVVEDSGSISLVAGRYYDIKMEYTEDVEPGVVRLHWTQPGAAKEIVPQSQLYPAIQGLRATYYWATNMTPTYAQWVRVDETVNFSWGTNSPEPTVLGIPYAARWIGKVKANAAGQYKFFTSSDDAARLYVNGQLLIDNWSPHALTENSNTITLPNAGQFYDLTMEYFNLSGTGTAVLSWQPPGESKQVIPASNLTPQQNNSPPMLTTITNFVAARGGTVSFSAIGVDADAPGQSLAFSLDAGSPPGASIDPSNGAFTWAIPNNQSFGPRQFVVRVTDNGLPQMSDAQTVTVTVLTNPTLSFARSPGFVVFKWPESSNSVRLYSATNLLPPASWIPVVSEAVLSNGERAVEIQVPSNGMQFFRLGPQ